VVTVDETCLLVSSGWEKRAKRRGERRRETAQDVTDASCSWGLVYHSHRLVTPC